MFERYKGRLISTIAFLIGMTAWNIVFYVVKNYEYDPWLDLPFTLAFALTAWYLGSYFDKSKVLFKRLSNSEENYKKLLETNTYLFNNLNQVVYQTDHMGCFTVLNPAWESITGYAPLESIGRSLLFYVYHEDQEWMNQRAIDTIKNNTPIVQEELRLRKKDGGFVWIEVNSKFNFNDSGDLISTVGTLTDITDWKLSELKLLQLNEDLAIHSDKLSVVANMSAAIAHEVRNPLTSISGFIQLLKEQRHLQKEYIDVIFSEIERIELVLSEMLLLSKPQVVNLRKFDLINTLDYVIALISTKANMNSIEIMLKKDNHHNNPIWVYGEENQMKQVFINIIKNAIEAMQNGGKVHVSLVKDCKSVSIYFSDTGCGIPKDTLDKIGQPFYTTKEKGTGLGLTTCFKIIENHKGKIHISSQVDIGTTFEVILPLIEADVPAVI
ncbi:ATP-binding protein [Robertmurraya korlensis]|uniref:ATP-binding protein n=1 Tax=Robertmurraya korlensis TaxID=519977 RepID=UPI0008266355|nr:ATP-binding protein [Robertmurraya korlensis]